MRLAAIDLDVFERDPFTFITYPSTPTLIPTDFFSCDDNNDGQINFDVDNNNKDNNEHTDNDNSNNYKSDNIYDNSNGNDHDTTNVNNDNKNNHGSKGLAGEKRKLGGNIVPFCKDRLIHIMKSIATSDNPSNVECYNYEFITAETQYELMEEFFPNLQQYCTIDRLQYWVGQSNIWGPHTRKTMNGNTKYGRHLWIVRKEMREFLVESTNPISAYWDHIKNEVDFITIGYARKSPTKENDASRTRLLQLMVDKLYYRMKYHLLSAIKGCNGGITYLTKRIHYTQKHIRLAIIDYAGLSTSPNDIRKFLDTYPNIKESVIDHGKSFEILNQHQLLERNDAEKFNCRPSPVQRSK